MSPVHSGGFLFQFKQGDGDTGGWVGSQCRWHDRVGFRSSGFAAAPALRCWLRLTAFRLVTIVYPSSNLTRQLFILPCTKTSHG
jgi:hypothetical protein